LHFEFLFSCSVLTPVGRPRASNSAICESLSSKGVLQPDKQGMNKTTLHLEGPQPSQVRRADLAPAIGYAMLVDGRFKTEFLDQDAATNAALDLLAKYPKLKIEIYDAASKSRTPAK
jgi:hypothetical protein